MTDRYRLYGAEFSYYSGKIRSYLRCKNIPFDEIFPSLSVYRKVIVPRTGVRYIPIVITPDDTTIQDTTDIIDALEQRFPHPSVYPSTPKQRLAALWFEVYGDEWLLIPAMHYRWGYPEHNAAFILGEFGRIVLPWAPASIRRLVGARLAARFRALQPMLGITPNTRPAIESWYEAFLQQLDTHLSRHDFLLGGRPSIGDFGLIGPLYAHLYRDPYPGRLMRRIAPAVVRWVERMMAGSPAAGDFLAGDEVPETLQPILRRLFAEHLPVLADTAQRVAVWLDAHPGENPPRTIGRHEFSIGGIREQRAVLPYSQWMLQRPLDFYHALAGGNKRSVDAWLDGLGGLEGMQTVIRRRLQRVDNRLVPV